MKTKTFNQNVKKIQIKANKSNFSEEDVGGESGQKSLDLFPVFILFSFLYFFLNLFNYVFFFSIFAFDISFLLHTCTSVGIE